MPRVLVVEDELKVAEALREGLEGERFEVLVARTRNAAVTLAESGNPLMMVPRAKDA